MGRSCNILLIGVLVFGNLNYATGTEQPNVLFISIDDLRPLLGCYGNTAIHTPHIDQLAERSAVFLRAYCQAPQCAPSRTSLLSGLRPETTGVFSARNPFDRQKYPEMLTLPECFEKQGYHTQCFGKISHDEWGDLGSWSVPSSPGRKREMWETVDTQAVANVRFEDRAKVPTEIRPRNDCVAIQAADVPDDTLYAGRMTLQAIDTLKKLKDHPFFLAVGYRRPHLPLVAPKQYFDMYPTDKITLPEQRQAPLNAPNWSIYNTVTYWHRNARKVWNIDVDIPKYPESLEQALEFAGWELRSYRGIPTHGPISDSLQKDVWQAYMACVSYVDAQIGRLLATLRRHHLEENTIVVLWSDHGWHLGEHGTWAKMTLFEWSTRIPLIVSAPTRFQPNRIKSLVELIDVYPTLCELANLPIPKHVEGTSFVPLMRQPNQPWKTGAFSQFPRHDHSRGQTVRTNRYRYTEWTSSAGIVKGKELYDHQADPLELINIANLPTSRDTVTKIADQLHAGWRSALPTTNPK